MPAGYQVKHESITVADHNFLIQSLLDRNQFFDPASIAQDKGISSAMWPLFGILWPSGVALAHIISKLSLKGQAVLEVGCGIGLPSMVASRKGADITASDFHPLAETFLRINCELNDLCAIKFMDGDWRKPIDSRDKFDLIFGSDLLYESEAPGILSNYIDAHAAQDALIIIIDPGRKLINKFSKLMQNKGYVCTIATLPELDLGRKSYKTKSYTFHK